MHLRNETKVFNELYVAGVYKNSEEITDKLESAYFKDGKALKALRPIEPHMLEEDEAEYDEENTD